MNYVQYDLQPKFISKHYILASIPLQTLHIDMWGSAPVKSIAKFRYYVSIVDECIRFTWFYPMINKSKFSPFLLSFMI